MPERDIPALRAELRREIEATHRAFHALLAEIPDSAFALPTDNAAWNVGEVLYHMSIAPRMMSTDVKMITGRSPLLRLVPIIVPQRLFDWLNKHLTRYGARRGGRAGTTALRQFLADAYDNAHAKTLHALAVVADEDFDKQLFYPDWDPLLAGSVDLERLFHYVKVHFDAHAGQLRRSARQAED